MADESTNPFAEEVKSDDQRQDEKEEKKLTGWQKMKKYTSKAWNVAKFALGISGDGSHGSYTDLSESGASWRDKDALEKEYTTLVSQKKDIQSELDSLVKETKGVDFFKLLGEYQQVKEVQNLTKINKLKGEEASLLRERDSSLVSLMGGYDLSEEDKQNKVNEVQGLVDKLSKVREELASREAATQKETVMNKIFSLKEARKLVNKVISKFDSDDKDAKAVAMNSIEGGIGPTVIVKKLDVIQIKIDILRNEVLRRLNDLEDRIKMGEFGTSAAGVGGGGGASGNGKGEEEGGGILDTIVDAVKDKVQEEVEDYVTDKVKDKFKKLGKKGWDAIKGRKGRSGHHKMPKKAGFFKRVGRGAGKLIGRAGRLIGIGGSAATTAATTAASTAATTAGAAASGAGGAGAVTIAKKAIGKKATKDLVGRASKEAAKKMSKKGTQRVAKNVVEKALKKTGSKIATKAAEKSASKIGSKAASSVAKKFMKRGIGRIFQRVALKLAGKAAMKGAAYAASAAVPVLGWAVGAAMLAWDAYELTKYLYLDPKKRKRIVESIRSVDDQTWKTIISKNLTQDMIKDKEWGQDEVDTLLNLSNYSKEAVDQESKDMLDSAIESLGIDNINALTSPYNLTDDKLTLKQQIKKEQDDAKQADVNSTEGNSGFGSFLSKAKDVTLNALTFGMYGFAKSAASTIGGWFGMGGGMYDYRRASASDSGTYIDDGMVAEPKKFGTSLPPAPDPKEPLYDSKLAGNVLMYDLAELRKERDQDKQKGKTLQEAQNAVIAEFEQATGKKIKFKLKVDSQNFHSLRRLRPEIIDEIDRLARDLGVRTEDLVVTSTVSDILGTRGGDPAGRTHGFYSKHYKGMAVDIRTSDNPKIRGKLYQWVKQHGQPTRDKSGKIQVNGFGKGYYVRPDLNTRTLFEDPNGDQEHIHFELNKAPNDLTQAEIDASPRVKNAITEHQQAKEKYGLVPKATPAEKKDTPPAAPTVPNKPKESSTTAKQEPPKGGTIVQYVTNVNNNTNYSTPKQGVEGSVLKSETK